jgi:hypothetical protein
MNLTLFDILNQNALEFVEYQIEQASFIDDILQEK